MRKKNLPPISAILVLAGVTAFIPIIKTGSDVQLKSEKVFRGEIVSTVIAARTVEAILSVMVGTWVPGIMLSLCVNSNSQVKACQLIGQILPTICSARGNQARAILLAGEAKQREAEATLSRVSGFQVLSIAFHWTTIVSLFLIFLVFFFLGAGSTSFGFYPEYAVSLLNQYRYIEV